MDPDVGAVERHEDRDVADDRDAALVGIVPNGRPLIEEDPLDPGVKADVVGEVAAGGGDGVRLAQRQRPVPVGPARLLVDVLERQEEAEVVEPACVMRQEGRQCRSVVAAGCLLEAGERSAQPVELELLGVPELDHVRRERWPGEIARRQPAPLDQRFERDQQWSPGERRPGRVRRVAESDRTERHHLPDALARGLEHIHEAVGCRAEVAGAVRSRQRGRVEQDASGAGQSPVVGWTVVGGRHSSSRIRSVTGKSAKSVWTGSTDRVPLAEPALTGTVSITSPVNTFL